MPNQPPPSSGDRPSLSFDFSRVSAHGKRHRYRYYACWTTQRYGKKACTGERLRADALEDAVLTALVDLYSDPELIARAPKANQQSSVDTARQQREELAATEAEIAKTEAAVDRYMHAFEAGTLTADIFADRVRDLGDKARALRLRHAELGRVAAEVEAPLPTLREVTALRDQLRDVALHGPGRVRKAVAQAFVHSLTVESRDRILPKFQVRRGLTIEQTGEHDGNPSQGGQGRGVRAMTPTVGRRHPYSNLDDMRKRLLGVAPAKMNSSRSAPGSWCSKKSSASRPWNPRSTNTSWG